MNLNVNNDTVGTSRAALGSALRCRYLVIKAHTSNGDDIYVGDSSVTSSNGFQLDAGEELVMGSQGKDGYELIDLANVYVVGGASSQAYSIFYY